MFERFRKGSKISKKNEEFTYGTETAPAPVIAPPATPTTTPRPWRPVPTQVPKPGTEEKPMGTFQEVMDIFFAELDKIKDTPEGQEIIKNIQNRYGNI
jgi:hypothetical protein